MVEKAQGHRLLNSRRNAAGIFDAGISNIQMSSAGEANFQDLTDLCIARDALLTIMKLKKKTLSSLPY